MDELYDLPDEWTWTRLGDVAKYINGRVFKPSDWEMKGLPIIRIQNLTNPNAKFNYYSKPVDRQFYVQDGDLLISWSATLDAFIWNRGKAILNQHIFRVEEDRNKVGRKFLFFVVRAFLETLKSHFHRCRSSGGLRRCWTEPKRCGPSAAPPSRNSTRSATRPSSISSVIQLRTRSDGQTRHLADC